MPSLDSIPLCESTADTDNGNNKKKLNDDYKDVLRFQNGNMFPICNLRYRRPHAKIVQEHLSYYNTNSKICQLPSLSR